MWKYECEVRFKICLNYWYSCCPKTLLPVCRYEKSTSNFFFWSLKLLLKWENLCSFKCFSPPRPSVAKWKGNSVFTGLFKTKKFHTVRGINFVELDSVTCVHLSIGVYCMCRLMLETEMKSFQRHKWWMWISYHECMIIFLHILICLWNRFV